MTRRLPDTLPKTLTRAFLVSPLFAVSISACSNAPDDIAQANETTPATASDSFGAYSPVTTLSGDILTLSQVYAPAGANGVIAGDIESQLGSAILVLEDQLQAMDLDLSALAHVTIHIVVSGHDTQAFEAAARAWQRSFANQLRPYVPARSLVGVSALPEPGARVAITALASRPTSNPDQNG